MPFLITHCAHDKWLGFLKTELIFPLTVVLEEAQARFCRLFMIRQCGSLLADGRLAFLLCFLGKKPNQRASQRGLGVSLAVVV